MKFADPLRGWHPGLRRMSLWTIQAALVIPAGLADVRLRAQRIPQISVASTAGDRRQLVQLADHRQPLTHRTRPLGSVRRL